MLGNTVQAGKTKVVSMTEAEMVLPDNLEREAMDLTTLNIHTRELQTG
jgi:hypothetical protein